jgi:hypothetical protein
VTSVAGLGGWGRSLDTGAIAPSSFHEDTALGPPDLSEAPRIELQTWQAWRAPDQKAALVRGCFATRVDTWSPELGELALDKMRDVIANAAIRAVGTGGLLTVATKTTDASIERTFEGRDGTTLDARAVQGFVLDAHGYALQSCFVLCADTQTPSRCALAIENDTTLPSTFVAPPPPSTTLRAALALVHHPHEAAMGLVALAVLGGAVMVMTRKRPGRKRSAVGP